jgi:ABC-2 type transport system permease protein
MSAAATSWHAFMAVLRRDMHVFLSYRVRAVSQAMTALFSLTLFYYVSRLVHVKGFHSPDAYFGFVVVGIALLGVLYSCFSIAELVRQELVAGTFDRLLLSPFGAVRGVLAMTIFPMIYSFAMAAVTLAVGCVVFGLQLHWPTVPLSLPAILLVLLAFLPFGVLFAAVTILVKQGAAATTWVIAMLSIVGGLYFPVSLLPQWLQEASKAQPFTAGTDLLRHLLVGTPLTASVASTLIKLAAFAIVLLPASLAALAACIRIGQRRGTIIEY